MTAVLAVFVLLYSGLLGCWAIACAVRGRTPGLGYLGGLVLLELTLLARAGIELARLVTASGGTHGEFGRGYAEPGVHAGYLLASIVVLPLVLTVTRTTRALTPSDDLADRATASHSPDIDRQSERDTATAAEPVKTAGSRTAGRTTAPDPISVRRAGRREATWDALVAAVGCAAVAVVTIRMGMTGRPA